MQHQTDELQASTRRALRLTQVVVLSEPVRPLVEEQREEAEGRENPHHELRERARQHRQPHQHQLPQHLQRLHVEVPEGVGVEEDRDAPAGGQVPKDEIRLSRVDAQLLCQGLGELVVLGVLAGAGALLGEEGVEEEGGSAGGEDDDDEHRDESAAVNDMRLAAPDECKLGCGSLQDAVAGVLASRAVVVQQDAAGTHGSREQRSSPQTQACRRTCAAKRRRVPRPVCGS